MINPRHAGHVKGFQHKVQPMLPIFPKDSSLTSPYCLNQLHHLPLNSHLTTDRLYRKVKYIESIRFLLTPMSGTRGALVEEKRSHPLGTRP